MATTSSQKMKEEEVLNPNPDNKLKKKRRIIRHTSSDLPNEILEHIFSFLSIKSVAQTTVLSKYWKHQSLWRYHPHLDFFPLAPKPLNSRGRLSHKFQSKATEFVPIILSRRQQDSNITTFRLFGHVTCSRLSNCIDRVMKHRIEQLELDVYLTSSFTLPPCLFYCNTLRVLTLNHQKTESIRSTNNPRKKHYRLLVLRTSYIHFNYYDTSVGLPSVHTLSLTNVYFNRGSDLFSGDKFPLLRNLWLKNCRGMTDLNINCPGLEILKLEGLWLKGLDISGVGLLELQVINSFRFVGSWTKICAASLRSIYWVSTTPVEFATEIFRDLNTGFLCFPSKTLISASKFISTLCYAQSLSVRSQVLESLSKLDFEGGLPCSFHNLLTLDLHTNMTKDEITGMTCLLRSSPLHTITIRINHRSDFQNGSWNKKQYWKSQIQNLKSIELHFKVARIDVRGTKMHKSAVCLVKLLLRHGRALQDMTLTLKSTNEVPPSEQRRIRSQIMKCARASSNVVTSFLSQDP